MKAGFEAAGRSDITILDDLDADYVKDKGMKTTQVKESAAQDSHSG